MQGGRQSFRSPQISNFMNNCCRGKHLLNGFHCGIDIYGEYTDEQTYQEAEERLKYMSLGIFRGNDTIFSFKAVENPRSEQRWVVKQNINLEVTSVLKSIAKTLSNHADLPEIEVIANQISKAVRRTGSDPAVL